MQEGAEADENGSFWEMINPFKSRINSTFLSLFIVLNVFLSSYKESKDQRGPWIMTM